MRRATLGVTVAMAVVALLAAAPAAAQVSVTMGPVMVDTTMAGEATVSVEVTNDGGGKIKVDLNVIALGNCSDDAGSVFTCDAYDCSRNGVAGVNGVSLGAGASTTLTVTIPLPAGDHLFRARVTGYKGGDEDQKFGVKPATVL